MRRIRASLIVAVCSLLMVLSCSDPAQPPILSDTGDPAAFARALPFPADHVPSVLSTLHKDGSEDAQRSDGAVVEGTALVLDSAGSDMEFAIYIFNPGLEPNHVDFIMDEAATSEFYVAFADYSSMRWVLDGPFSAGHSMQLDPAISVSPLGNIPLAVVVAGGGTATIDAVELSVENNPPLADIDESHSGVAPVMVSFDASDSSDSDGSIVLYEWDWEADGVYDASGTETIQQHEYTVPGDYTARLRVTDDLGVTSTAEVAFTVLDDANPVAAITLSPDGEAPLEVTASATLSSDDIGITKFEWDLDGDGTFEHDSGLTPEAQVTFNDPLAYTIGLRVTDTVGQTGTDEAVATAQGWRSIVMTDNLTNVSTVDFLNANGQPALAYFNDQEEYIYVVSTTEFGIGESDWRFVGLADGEELTESFVAMALVDGNPAVACVNGDGDVEYHRSSTAFGELQADWDGNEVGQSSTTTELELEVINGHPALAYSGDGELRYARSLTTMGTAFEDWNFAHVVLDTDASGHTCSLAQINGKPAIAYHSPGTALYYAEASTESGNDIADWSSVDTELALIAHPDLLEVTGKPVLALYDGAEQDLVYAFPDTTNGLTGTWQRLDIDTSGPRGAGPSLALINGMPAIASFAPPPSNAIVFQQSTTAGGFQLADWQPSDPALGSAAATPPRLRDLNGRPAIGYIVDVGLDDYELHYAVMF